MRTINKIVEITKNMMSESHRRQFAGEDWQTVANDIAGRYESLTEDQYNLLRESPDPACDCGFCATANWQP